jgi:CDP-diglyceride synthetase
MVDDLGGCNTSEVFPNSIKATIPATKTRVITAGVLVTALLVILSIASFYPKLKWIIPTVALLVTTIATFEIVCFVSASSIQPKASVIIIIIASLFLPVFAGVVLFKDGSVVRLEKLIFPLLIAELNAILLFELVWQSRKQILPTLMHLEYEITALLLGGGGVALMVLSEVPRLFCFLLFVVASNDVAAYFIGRRWGQSRLAPVISPKKTIEGSLGGLFSGIVSAFLYYTVLQNVFGINLIKDGVIYIFGAAILIGIASQGGDLAKSLIKRRYNVKDSSRLLPGHGGVLDRCDGIFAGALMVLCLMSFGWL